MSWQLNFFPFLVSNHFPMTLHQFKKRTETEKLNTVERKGVLITDRQTSFSQVQLYQLANLYLELYYPSPFNVLLSFHPFEETDYLEPYFQNINIEPRTCA